MHDLIELSNGILIRKLCMIVDYFGNELDLQFFTVGKTPLLVLAPYIFIANLKWCPEWCTYHTCKTFKVVRVHIIRLGVLS